MNTGLVGRAFRIIGRKIGDPRLARRREAVAAAPLDPQAHRELAEALARAGRFHAAHAALRSAAFLAPNRERSGSEVRYAASPDALRNMNHNRYFRFETLSRKLQELAGGGSVSVLDVGGGDGELAPAVAP